jgi:hypothetical protein
MMNLLLNFESYDQTTKDQDVYMPDEKLIHFNLGFLKLNFIGKLRLTQNRDKTQNKPEIKSGIDTPMNTYGIVEEDLYIKFDKPVYIKNIYARLHKADDLFNDKPQENNIVGYRKDKEIISAKLDSNNYNWVMTINLKNII